MPVPSVCTENSIRVDHVSESPNVGDDDRAILPLPGPIRLAVQVEEPTWGRERCAPTSARHIAAEGARPCPAHGCRSFGLHPAVSTLGGAPSCACTHIAAIDLFIAPTIGFDLLYVLVIIRLERRKLVRINVTRHPTAEWIARQVTEAFPWAEAPRYLIRDRDRVYGAAVTHRLWAMGIRDKPIAPGSPWQNGSAERLIGSIRRECVDHIVVLGETHLRRILTRYAAYYNELRTHVSWQRRSDLSRYPARRLHRIGAGRRWPSPPLSSNLVFGTDNGGALGSGAPRGNKNALKRGRFTREAIAERAHIRELVRQARKLLLQME